MPRHSAENVRAVFRRHGPSFVAMLALAVASAGSQPARAQESSPSGGQGQPAPDSGGRTPRLAVGGDVTVTVGPKDEYFFNYTDYEQNALRLFVGSLGASFITTSWLEAVGEVRVENTDRFEVSALYARITPWASRPVTFLAGRVPPVFGAFSRTRYGNENPLISRPLGYQYLSTLRPDDVPRSADSLLAVRGRGWLVHYPGSTGVQPAAGVPVISSTRWDTGLVVNVTSPRFDVSGGITMGSLSDPRVEDNNDGKQLVVRAEFHPTAAWSFGMSAAGGAFLSRGAASAAGATRENWPQRALGLDASFSRGHLQVRGEVVAASWSLPTVDSPPIHSPLDGYAATVETRYRVHPRLDAAVRADWLGFSSIQGTLYGGQPTPWDGEVSRVEVGGGVRIARGWLFKLAYQYDWRFGRRRVTNGYPAAQLAVWF